jgi:hypothetical protein
MSARLSIACVLLAALLLPRGPVVQAKPPDLPAVMPVICAPLAPVRDDATVPLFLDKREEADIHVQAQAEAGKRTLTRCLLFAAHPLLALLPLEDLFAEDEEIPVANRGICPGSRYDWLAEARQRQRAAENRPAQTDTAAEEEDAAPTAAKPVSACPYLQNKKLGRCPTVTSAFIEASSALENLDKLERAEQLYREAESCRRRGHTVEAISCYEAIRTLCPGSRYDEMASDRLRALRGDEGEEAAETGAEELQQRLRSPINLDVTDMPLARLLDELRVLTPHGLSIKVDQSTIEAAGLNLRQPVTMKLEQVSVERVLRLVLHGTNLIYRIKDGAVFITTPAGAEEESNSAGGKDQSWAPSKPHGVSALLESCQRALHEGHYAQADALARRALALDIEAVEAHPLVYKMHLFDQLRRAGRGQGQREARTSGLILAIDEVSGGEEQEPRERPEQTLWFVKPAPAELFLVERSPEARAGEGSLARLLVNLLKPGNCVEWELSSEGARGRFQFDLGSTGLRLTWERGGSPSLLIWTYGGSETGTDR